MAKISKVEPLVYKALIENPSTRADDFLLLLEVYKNFITGELTFETVVKHHIELGLPSYVTIPRIRRRLQKRYPELESENATKIRAEEEKEYKAYAINN